MKTTINRKELVEFEACEDGLDKFTEIHSDKTVKLSDCFKSNTLGDVFWLLEVLESKELLSDLQIKDLRLYAADVAESVLHIFEKEHPDDNRPRLAIKAARDFANGLIDEDTLAAASDAAWAAARAADWAAARAAASDAAWSAASDAARSAASDAARSAAWAAARSAAWAAAWAADWAAARATHSAQLKTLFISWEHKANETT